jgi:hypothetical protein
MQPKQINEPQDIEIKYNPEYDELLIGLTEDGIAYLSNILSQLQSAGIGAHQHIDYFDGWLGGEFKHLVILKQE